EALLRWRHPVRGLLTPGDFLETAERVGLLAALGPWLGDQVLTQAESYPQVWFSLNRLVPPDPPPNLVVELHPGDPRPEGVRVALDQLGRRPWALESLPGATYAKLHRSLVAAVPENPGLCFAAVSLARSLRLQPVAVGVESLAQVQFLRGIN